MNATRSGQGLRIGRERLGPLRRLASDSGVDFARVVESLGIEPESNSEDDIPLTDYYRILQRLCLELRDETCHLSSRPLIPGSSHFIWSHVIGAENLYAAMQRVADAYNLLHGGSYNHVEIRDDTLRYLIDDRDFPYIPPGDDEHIVFSLECVLIFLHCTLMMISDAELEHLLERVYTRRTRPRDGHHLRFLGVPVIRNRRHYALVYSLPAAWLPVTASATDLPAPDAVYDRIIDLIAAGDSSGSNGYGISERVQTLLRNGLGNQRKIAGQLGMSVATLRRHLAAEGCTFRRLRADTLNTQAIHLLRQGKRPAEIAEHLGFSDTRSFNRAFKAWNGITPRAARGPGQ